MNLPKVFKYVFCPLYVYLENVPYSFSSIEAFYLLSVDYQVYPCHLHRQQYG